MYIPTVKLRILTYIKYCVILRHTDIPKEWPILLGAVFWDFPLKTFLHSPDLWTVFKVIVVQPEKK